MKMKFYNLTEDQLNHLAIKALKTKLLDECETLLGDACTRWDLCGLMIESLNLNLSSRGNLFVASVSNTNDTGCYGETQKIAIVRCFVAHIFGEDYETEL